MYLLDTNAMSELRKLSVNSTKTNKGFRQWAENTDGSQFLTSQIVILELRKGILLKARKDKQQSSVLEQWLNKILVVMHDKILTVTDEICWRCAELHIPNPRSEFDSLIGATALVHNLILVTNNTKDFEGIDNLRIINPFDR